jgi:hypothetical protein
LVRRQPEDFLRCLDLVGAERVAVRGTLSEYASSVGPSIVMWLSS